MPTFASDIAYGALSDLGVIRPGETPSATVQTDLLLRLNQFLASLSTEQLMAQTQVHGSYALTIGGSRYTFGVGGTMNTGVRPIKVTAWRATSGNFQSGGRVLTFEELQQVSIDGHGSQTSIPTAVGADAAYPLINIAVFPVTGTSPGVLELTYWTALTAFASLATTVTLPDGWERMLRTNFAVDLHPRYGRANFDITTLLKDAQDSKSSIAELNRSQMTPPAAH